MAALALLLSGLVSIAAGPARAQDQSASASHAEHHAQTHHPAHELSREKHGVAHAASHTVGHTAHPVPPHHPMHRAPAVVPVPVVKPAAPVAPPPPPVVSAPAKGSSTGLPLPRFASLRADAVNLRGGPGTRYPIQWVYKRRDLPVRIEREFDVWRLVEDSDGVKGWVHQATLIGTRTFVIPGGIQTTGAGGATTPAASDVPPASGTAGETRSLGSTSAPTVAGRLDAATGVLPAGAVGLRAQPQPDGALVAVLMPGIVGRIRSCSPGSGWCKVSVRDYSGWLPRSAFWGLLPDEAILPP